jgi:hypothetical protein
LGEIVELGLVGGHGSGSHCWEKDEKKEKKKTRRFKYATRTKPRTWRGRREG